ncbi:NAD(P)-binding domain-containing protein [Paenibacillus sp. EPM92]|uniref:NAD(P)-binding domain-containing protein n=1 Tax=Paenibacillus sp. EPM92 TaxID=1561195 RepID=UPI001915EFA2|nr:NAD(P)-binding domain-containing protein [Paenibacillus sp. EPM92]
MSKQVDVIVIGAGQAGLAAGYHLKKSGLQFLILESSGESAGSWPKYYDSLKLFSPARYSTLPGMSFPGPGDRYPLRDEVIAYLKDYALHFQFPIVYNSHVSAIQQESGTFRIITMSGETYQARNLICATGSFSRPFIPEIDGQNDFKGKVLHSSEYLRPDAFLDQSVIVVGRGNSAVQIAIELSEVAKTTLAVHEPVSLLPQRFLGRDIHFWLKVTGVDSFWSFGKAAANSSSVMDLGGYKKRLNAGHPVQKQMFTAFNSDGVIWPDGSNEKADAVIFATGFRSNLNFLQDIGALDGNGNPLQKAGISNNVPGLYFVGLSGQRTFSSATIRGVGRDASYVVNQILR